METKVYIYKLGLGKSTDSAHHRVSVAQWQNIGEQSPKAQSSIPYGDLEFYVRCRPINQSMTLFSDSGYKSGSHEADVDLQLTNKT